MSAELKVWDFVHRTSVSQLPLYLMCGFLSNFSCFLPWAIRSNFFLFWILEIYFLRIFFAFVIMGPYESQNFKPLLILRLAAKRFLNFLSDGPHKTGLGWLKFWVKHSDFFNFFFLNLNFTIVPYGETENPITNYLENERLWSKREWNLGRGASSLYMANLWPWNNQGHFAVILVHLRFFAVWA